MTNFYWDYNQNYLVHHGTKGQRWYHRRYQYEDGSLTPEGKIRYGVGSRNKKVNKIVSERLREQKKNDEKIAKKAVKEAHKKKNYSPDKTKPISEFSDADLAQAIARLNLEATYTQALQKLEPKQVDRGQKIVKSMTSISDFGYQALRAYNNINSFIAITNTLKYNTDKKNNKLLTNFDPNKK